MAWARANPVSASLLAVLAVTLPLTTLAMLQLGRKKSESQRIELPAALAALDAGDWPLARQLAQHVRPSPEREPGALGGPPFVLGAASAYEALSMPEFDQHRLHLLAARWLEESRMHGFPEGREAEGLFLLGHSLHQAGRYTGARPVLEEALKIDKSRAAEIHGLLAGAFLRDPNPDLPRALEHNGRLLATENLAPEIRRDALLERAHILLAQKNGEQCQQVIDLLSRDPQAAEDVLRLRARMLMLEADKAREPAGEQAAPPAELLGQAIRLLREVQARNRGDGPAATEAMYLIGVCLRKRDELPAAQEQFERVQQLDHRGPHGLAAALEAGEVAQQLGRDDRAVAFFRYLLTSLGPPETFSNPWFSLDVLRTRVLKAWQQYFDSRQYAFAVDLTSDLYPLASRVDSLSRRAEAYQAWARSLEIEAAAVKGTEAEPIHQQARNCWKSAGEAHAELARVRFATRYYTDDLWNAAQCLARGHDFQRSAAALREYLKYEPIRRRALALVALGEAFLALSQMQDALQAAVECIEFHHDEAAVYRARILASRVYREQGDLAAAKAALTANLREDLLTPASQEWRESLFLLGELLFDEAASLEAPTLVDDGRDAEPLAQLERADHAYRQALLRLEEAVARYPESEESVEARYLIADGHRRLARLPAERLKVASVQTTRLALIKQMREDLEAAVDGYAELQRQLDRQLDDRPLDEHQELLLRNAYFARAASLFELERFDEAAEAYADATSRYQQQPEALGALAQLSICYRRLNRPVEAQGAVEQARVVLQHLPEDVNLETTTPYNREEWAQYLDWLKSH